MSKAKANDERLIKRMLDESIRWLEDARQHPSNLNRDLYELARECANGAFKNHVVVMPVERREAIARKFMQACQDRFSIEVPRILASDAMSRKVEFVQ